VKKNIVAATLLLLATAMGLLPAVAQLKANQPGTYPANGIRKAATQPALELYGKLPLSFEANHGQADSRVKYLSRGRGYTLLLTGNEAVLSLAKQQAISEGMGLTSRRSGSKGSRGNKGQSCGTSADHEMPGSALFRMKLLGSNPRARATALDELPGKSNYLIGNDPKRWRTNLPTYARVRYQGVYPGVDLVFYGNQRQLEHDFVVAPGADPNSIRFGLEGSDRISLDKDGNLVLAVAGDEVQFQKPVIYQQDRGARREIAGGYVLKNNHEVKFEVGAYDHSQPLVIDPVLSYSTYLGGNGFDIGLSIAVDSTGSAYVTGQTASTNFPVTAGALQSAFRGAPIPFVAKLMPDGTALAYSTYLGGSGAINPFTDTNQGDTGRAIAVDSLGHAYITGQTSSTDFPITPGAFQTALAGEGSGCSVSMGNAFVAELNPTGSGFVYSTYLGGNNTDAGFGIAIDATGNAYVAGRALSTNFPVTPGAYRTTFDPSGFDCSCSGPEDVFVTKLNPSGTALVYSTYVGGGIATGVAIDSGGNAYVTGTTNSPSYPTTAGSFRTTPISAAGGCSDRDSIVTKLSADGSALVYSTYLGGSADDVANGIAVDASNNAYVTGETNSANFPTTAGALQTALAGSRDAFVTKLDPTGSSLVYSTYLGGSGSNQFGNGIAVDGSGNAFVSGYTDAANFPVTANASQGAFGGGAVDAFVAEINAAGSSLQFSTFLGGSGTDGGFGIALDTAGSIYVSGFTDSAGFPTTAGAFQTTFGGGSADAFVAKLSPTTPDKTPPTTNATPSPAANAAGWNNTNVTVSFNATDNSGGSGVKQITFSATGAQPIASTVVSGASASVNITGEGVTTVSYSATDNAGNVETSKTLTVQIDKTAPTTSAAGSPAANGAGWNNSNVTVSFSAGDNGGGSGVSQVTFSATGAQPLASTIVSGASASVNITNEGVTTISYFATDIAGNVEATKTLTVQLDKTPPAINCGSPDGAWHASDVTIGCTATDGGSGLDASSPSSFSLTTSVPAGTETASAFTNGLTVCDIAGNCTVAGPVGPNKVDKKPPQITIAVPSATSYKLNQAVASSYSCSDGGSGVATCAGPVPSGSSFDTASAGAKTFTVNASDNVGNASALSVSYSVGYTVCLLYDDTRAAKSGSTIPIKFQLCDALGHDVSSAGVTVTALQVVMISTNASTTVDDAGNANPDSNFRFDPTLGPAGGYIFNLQTTGLSTGTYVLTFTVSGDPTPHNSELIFQVR